MPDSFDGLCSLWPGADTGGRGENEGYSVSDSDNLRPATTERNLQCNKLH